MRKYKHKPTVVNAWKLSRENFDNKPDWVIISKHYLVERPDRFRLDMLHVVLNTKNGMIIASEGQYIIQSEDGSVYPVNENVFNFNYEEIEMARWSADCTIEELLAQREQMRDDLVDLEKFIYEKRLYDLADKLGVTFGKTLVEYNGNKFVIASLDEHLQVHGYNNITPWIAGWKICKNGKPSKNVRYVYFGHEKINIIGEYND